MVTKKDISDQLLGYLQHRVTLEDLVNWAENMLMEGDYIDDAEHTTRNTLAQLGLADVKTFGLEWKDCESIMERLGYKLEVQAKEVA